MTPAAKAAAAAAGAFVVLGGVLLATSSSSASSGPPSSGGGPGSSGGPGKGTPGTPPPAGGGPVDLPVLRTLAGWPIEKGSLYRFVLLVNTSGAGFTHEDVARAMATDATFKDAKVTFDALPMGWPTIPAPEIPDGAFLAFVEATAQIASTITTSGGSNAWPILFMFRRVQIGAGLSASELATSAPRLFAPPASFDVFPVATTSLGPAKYTDDFGVTGQGGSTHQGIDIFAAEGTPVVAISAGTIRHSEEGKGGHVVYLETDAGDRIFYGHLSAYEGDARHVDAGEVVGYVGRTGNAQGTDPHVHFELHAGGGVAVDPFDRLNAAPRKVLDMPKARGPAATSAPSDALLAKALAQAYGDKHPGSHGVPIELALAQAFGEGTTAAVFRASNNVGSMHATQGFASAHKDQAGYGMIAFGENGGSGPYIAKMAVYPSLLLGARSFLDLAENNVGGDLASVTTPESYSAAQYTRGYFTGTATPVTPVPQRAAAAAADTWTDADRTNIAAYAKLITSTQSRAQKAIDAMVTEPADPALANSGPPFAPLLERLGQGARKLTEAEARLRFAKSVAAGGISIDDALETDGVWAFGVNYPKHAPPEPGGAGDGQGQGDGGGHLVTLDPGAWKRELIGAAVVGALAGAAAGGIGVAFYDRRFA